jgi:hypothetical protein
MPSSSGPNRKLLDPYKSTTILRKVGKSLLVDTTSHPKIALWELMQKSCFPRTSQKTAAKKPQVALLKCHVADLHYACPNPPWCGTVAPHAEAVKFQSDSLHTSSSRFQVHVTHTITTPTFKATRSSELLHSIPRKKIHLDITLHKRINSFSGITKLANDQL